jgi:hypothetical protein
MAFFAFVKTMITKPTIDQRLERYRLAEQLGKRSTFLRAWMRIPFLLLAGAITRELLGEAVRVGRLARRARRLGRRAARRAQLQRMW